MTCFRVLTPTSGILVPFDSESGGKEIRTFRAVRRTSLQRMPPPALPCAWKKLKYFVFYNRHDSRQNVQQKWYNQESSQQVIENKSYRQRPSLLKESKEKSKSGCDSEFNEGLSPDSFSVIGPKSAGLERSGPKGSSRPDNLGRVSRCCRD
jgi:hypothetical protein